MRQAQGWLLGLLVATLAASLSAQPAQYEWRDGKWVALAAPAKGTAQGELAILRQSFEAGRHEQAVEQAQAFLKVYGDDDAAEEAMLLAAKAEIARGRYYQAYEWLNDQLKKFPAGPYYEHALELEYQVAEAFLAGKKRIVAKVFYLPAQTEGLEILDRIAEQAPGSGIAEAALMRVGDYHYAKAQYADAAAAYDRYLEKFPRSPRASYARLQAARSMLGSFTGVSRDETPLIEAEQRFRVFQQMYPRTADQTNVPGTIRQIVGLRAQMLYETARFYERTKHPTAAAFYYRQVGEQFPNTDWSSRADADLRRFASSGVRPAPQEAEPLAAPQPAPGQPGEDSASPKPQQQAPAGLDELDRTEQ